MSEVVVERELSPAQKYELTLLTHYHQNMGKIALLILIAVALSYLFCYVSFERLDNNINWSNIAVQLFWLIIVFFMVVGIVLKTRLSAPDNAFTLIFSICFVILLPVSLILLFHYAGQYQFNDIGMVVTALASTGVSLLCLWFIFSIITGKWCEEIKIIKIIKKELHFIEKPGKVAKE